MPDTPPPTGAETPPNPGRTHFADDDTLRHIAKLERELAAALRDANYWRSLPMLATMDIATVIMGAGNSLELLDSLARRIDGLSSRAQTKDKP